MKFRRQTFELVIALVIIINCLLMPWIIGVNKSSALIGFQYFFTCGLGLPITLARFEIVMRKRYLQENKQIPIKCEKRYNELLNIQGSINEMKEIKMKQAAAEIKIKRFEEDIISYDLLLNTCLVLISVSLIINFFIVN